METVSPEPANWQGQHESDRSSVCSCGPAHTATHIEAMIETELKHPITNEKSVIDWLVDPLSIKDFIGEYWGLQPLHISRNNPAYYSSLFSLATLDELLGFSFTNKNVRTAWDGHQRSPVILAGPDKTSICNFYEYYAQGQSVVIRNVHLRWEPIGALVNALSREIGFRVGTHLYATPEASQGFGIHWDDHDIFALQLEGQKEWTLFDSGPTLPRRSSGHREYQKQIIDDPGEPSHEILLEAGDLLYFPRGVIHRARAQTKSSLHLTFGIYPVTWEDALVKAIQLEDNGVLDRSLPPGFLSNCDDAGVVSAQLEPMLSSLTRNLDFGKVKTQLATDLMESLETLPDGHFSQLGRLGEVSAGTLVEKRPGMVAVFFTEKEGPGLRFPGNLYSGSSSESKALAFISENDQFRVGEIPLEEGDPIPMVRQLIAKGLLRVSSDS